jgi:hypothetical protein
MDEYQEDLIYIHFEGQALLNKFSITKARLYNNILRSLDSYHANSSIDAQLFKSLHYAEILLNKGLYKQSEKILRSASKQALKQERNHILLEIKQREKQLIEKALYASVNPTQLNKIYNEERLIINEIDAHSKLWKVKSLLFQTINSQGHVRDEKDTIKLKILIDQIKDLNPNEFGYNNLYLYNHIYSAYYFSVNDLPCCFHHLKINLSLFETEKEFLKMNPNIYFSVLTNIIFVSTRLKRYADAKNYLIQLKSLTNKDSKNQNLDLDIKYFSSTYSLELFLLNEQAKYESALKLIPQIEEGYRLYGEHIPTLRKAYLDFKVGVIYLSVGNYNEALSWINKILNESKIDQKQDLYCFAQLINLILHFELKNERFLPYAINSTKRYLKNRNKIYKFEELFLKLITHLSKTDNIFDIEEKLIPFEKALIKLKQDPKEEMVFEYFDFLTWVQSILKRVPFSELKQKQLLS